MDGFMLPTRDAGVNNINGIVAAADCASATAAFNEV